VQTLFGKYNKQLATEVPAASPVAQSGLQVDDKFGLMSGLPTPNKHATYPVPPLPVNLRVAPNLLDVQARQPTGTGPRGNDRLDAVGEERSRNNLPI
jgi:hypothetical protein